MPDDQKSKADLIEELVTLGRQLKTSEASCNENLGTVIRDSVDGILVVDPQGVVLFANPAAQRMLGLLPDQFIGTDAGNLRWQVVQEDGSDFPVENLPSRIVFQTGRKVSNVVIGFKNTHDDTRRWIRVNATLQFKPGEERPFQVYSTLEDITESKKAFDQSQRLAAIVRSTGNAIISKTLDGTITTWNPAAERMYGYGAEEAIGKNITMLVPDEAKADLERTLESIRSGNRVTNYETIRRRKDGTLIDVSLTVSPIHDEAGHVVGSSAIAQDISQLKRAVAERQVMEEQFHQSQKLESIGRLAGGVAHDFNNVLSVILGYGELMLSSLREPDPMCVCAKEVVAAGKRAAALTRQLLAFSRKQTLQPRILNLNDIISNLKKMLGRLIGEDIQLTTALGEDLCRVEVDPGQIEQVIMNIAVNARDAMPQGGVFSIETRNVAMDERYAKEHINVEPGDYVLLAMTDNGCGMNDATRKKLFEPFFTTKEKGRGRVWGLRRFTVSSSSPRGISGFTVNREKGRSSRFICPAPPPLNPQPR